MIQTSTPCLNTVSSVRGEQGLIATVNIERPAPSWFPFRPRTVPIIEVGHIDDRGEFCPFMGICADHVRPLINILQDAALKLEYEQDD